MLIAYATVMFAFFPLLMQDSEGPQSSIPELNVLSNYAGNWDSEFRIKSMGSEQETEKFTGTVEGKWAVGGRYLEQTGTYVLSSNSPPMVIKTMMTFDVDDQDYRYDLFVSSGGHSESRGKWDAEKKTMTSIMHEDDGRTMTTIADFSQPGIETWTIEIQDSSGETTSTIKGINTRRKDSP